MLNRKTQKRAGGQTIAMSHLLLDSKGANGRETTVIPSLRRNPPRGARHAYTQVSRGKDLDECLESIREGEKLGDMYRILYGPSIGPRGPQTRLQAKEQRQAMEEIDIAAGKMHANKADLAMKSSIVRLNGGKPESEPRRSARLAAQLYKSNKKPYWEMSANEKREWQAQARAKMLSNK